jgi:hypothetical protein
MFLFEQWELDIILLYCEAARDEYEKAGLLASRSFASYAFPF